MNARVKHSVTTKRAILSFLRFSVLKECTVNDTAVRAGENRSLWIRPRMTVSLCAPPPPRGHLSQPMSCSSVGGEGG